MNYLETSPSKHHGCSVRGDEEGGGKGRTEEEEGEEEKKVSRRFFFFFFFPHLSPFSQLEMATGSRSGPMEEEGQRVASR